ncbi:MAG TPA: hypothetical protein VFZ69_13445 [Longimicrobiales bacterium]
MHHLLTLALSAQIGVGLPADSIETLRSRARSAEARFERLTRQLAPVVWTLSSGTDCDEIVGRFCLRFDSTTTPPAAPEAGRAVDARREAVEAVRRYFSAAPAELRAAGPLVRLLVNDQRPGEAVSGAGAFAALSGDTLWGDLLLGYANHWAGVDSAAERHFIAALARMTEQERAAWLDIARLLDPDERGRVRRLPPEARAEYDRRFWLMADPFWMTAANERWAEHLSRGVEARLLAEVPLVGGMTRWGRDLDELTIRYGTPSSRARVGGSTPLRTGMIEYWDTVSRAYDPVRSSDVFRGPPLPGTRAPLYAAAARTAYALQIVERVVEPDHQVSRFLRRDSVILRVDAAVPVPVTVAAPRIALLAFDSAFTRRSATFGRARSDGDTARFTLTLGVPHGRTVYSVELLADSVLGARARYSLDTRLPDSGPVVSDLLVTLPFEAAVLPDRFDDRRLRPRTSLVVEPGDTLGVYAELYRLSGAPLEIELALERSGGPSLLRRFGRWLGLLDAGDAPRVGWRTEAAEDRHVIALNLPLDDERSGLHDLVLRVTDRSTGQRAESRRQILIRD